MLFSDLIPPSTTAEYIQSVLKTQCSDFLKESAGLPVYKALPGEYDDFRRVKVRFQKKRVGTSDVFAQAFADDMEIGFKERAVLVHTRACTTLTEDQSLFYVFPINGYKYLFSPTVKNSEEQFNGTAAMLLQQLDVEESNMLITDLLKYSYQQTNLREGLNADCELIIHNISSFFVVNTSTFPNYRTLIS